MFAPDCSVLALMRAGGFGSPCISRFQLDSWMSTAIDVVVLHLSKEPDMAFQTFESPWIKGYDLGVGVDMPSGSRMGRSVEPIADGVDSAMGTIGNFSITRITDSSSLQKALEINVEASYGAGAFGAGVSARMNFAQSQEINEQSLFLCVVMNIELGFQSIDEPRLTEAAAAAAGDPGLFQSRYGDMFVSGIASGGMFVAVMKFYTKDSKESKEIAAALEGSYGLFSGSADTKLTDIQKRYKSELSITIYHEGGPADLIVTDKLEDPGTMLALAGRFAEAFVNDPKKAAVPYSVTISPIQIAEGPPPPNSVEVQHAADVLLVCARRRDSIMDAISTLTYVHDNADRYDQVNGATTAQVEAAMEGAQSDLDLVADCAAAALRNRADAVTPEEFAKARGVAYPAYAPLNPAPKLLPGVTAPPAATPGAFVPIKVPILNIGPGALLRVPLGNDDGAKS